MNRSIAYFTVVLLLAGCGKDQIVEPTLGAGCSKGTLAPGDTLHGSLTPEACLWDYNLYAGEVRYATYRVHLTAGQGYLMREQSEPDSNGIDDLDSEMQLWGTDANGTRVPLAMSDDDGGSSNNNLDSEIWFVAPASGDYTLFTTQYELGDDGGYRVSMQQCPVVAKLDTAGTYTGLTLAASPPNPCLRHKIGAHAADSSGAVLAALPLHKDDSVTIAVISSGFSPAVEAGGPGFDVYTYFYDNTLFKYAVPTVVDTTYIHFTAPSSGTYSVLIGAETSGDAGLFQINLSKTEPPSPVAEPVPHLKPHPARVKQRTR